MIATLERGTIPMLTPQTFPCRTQAQYLDRYTAITRVWRDGESKDCRRCVQCQAIPLSRDGSIRGEVCTVLVDGVVPIERCKTYDSRDLDDEGADQPSTGIADRPLRLGL